MDNHPDDSSPVLPAEPAQTGNPTNHKLRVAIAVAVVAVLAGLAFYYKGLFIAATVDGSPVSRLAVIRLLEKQSGKAALDSLITEKLVNAAAQAKGITVSSAELAAAEKTIEQQVTSQGGTLTQALTAQGMTQQDFDEQVTLQKKLEKLLADQIQVSADEVAQYIKDNQLTAPAGQETGFTNQIKGQLQQQKLTTAAGSYLDRLRTQAKINYFVNY